MTKPRPHRPPEHSRRRKLKLFAERNTGSGYLERLLSRNLHVDLLPGGFPRSLRRIFPESERARDGYFRATSRRNLGWKHAFPPSAADLATASIDTAEILFLTLTKNPYAWLVSLYQAPYHATRTYSSFSQFLSEPWEPVERENAKQTFANPVELWNQKNAAYLALGKTAPTHAIQYEELIEDPRQVLERLCRDHGLTWRPRPFENVMEATKGRDRHKTFDDYREYYTHERWRSELDENAVEQINAGLNPEVMSAFGYAWVEASEARARREGNGSQSRFSRS